LVFVIVLSYNPLFGLGLCGYSSNTANLRYDYYN
jgi:hypothetical protein